MALIKNHNLLVLAINSQQASFFTQAKRFAELQPLSILKPDTVIKRNSDIDADRYGRSFDRFGKGRHAIQPATEGVQHAHHCFAKDAAQQAAQLYSKNRCEAMLITGTPVFIGLLRQQLKHHKAIEHIEYIVSNPNGLSATELQELITAQYGVQRLVE